MADEFDGTSTRRSRRRSACRRNATGRCRFADRPGFAGRLLAGDGRQHRRARRQRPRLELLRLRPRTTRPTSAASSPRCSTSSFDRNVMTIDAFDWVHRTGANPPDDLSRAILRERAGAALSLRGQFAHEYQHLLEYYEDPDEYTWINEGLADVRGGADGLCLPEHSDHAHRLRRRTPVLPRLGIASDGREPEPGTGGPENSLTFWGDQGDADELLCDYGAAESFMHSRRPLRRRCHLDAPPRNQNGLDVRSDVLRGAAVGAQPRARYSTTGRRLSRSTASRPSSRQPTGGPRSRSAPPRSTSTSTGTTRTHTPRRARRPTARTTSGCGAAAALRLRSPDPLDHVRRRQVPPAPDPIEWVVDHDPPLQPGDRSASTPVRA